MKGLFNPTDTICRAVQERHDGHGGAGLRRDQHVPVDQAVHDRHACRRRAVTTTVSTQGQTTIAITGTGADIARVTCSPSPACYAVNPQTRESTGSLQQFVVPRPTRRREHVHHRRDQAGDLHALTRWRPWTRSRCGQAVTFVGTPSTPYPQNLIYQKDAFSFATADMLMPQGVEWRRRQVHNGISMRIVRQYDINNDRMPCRIDVLYGYAAIRPPMGVRLWG